ncbi:MAG: efflux RND transporter periplasmic adaptor subunit [Pseudomonadota bacterium]|nr:efflux RND transporter periplasmic adaptor subunit [Pseudomonadota bacterium]
MYINTVKRFLALSIFLFSSYSYANDAQQPVPVQVMQLSAMNVPVKVELPTVLMGSEEVEIRARVAGIVEKIHFKDGDQVKKGDLLYSLDTEQLEATLARLDADQEALKARLDQANRNLKRVNTLKTQRAIAQKDVDDAVSEQAIAKADILAGEARLKEARLNLNYAKIKAPINGFVSRSLVSEGDYIQSAGDVLVNLTQLNPIYARFSIPTRSYQAIQAEAMMGSVVLPPLSDWKAKLKFGHGQYYDQVGTVDFLDVKVDPLTGAQESRATFPNPNNRLQPGQYMRIFVEGAYRPNAIAVPQEAVLDGPQGKYVYRYAKQEQMYVAQPQPVQLGEWVVLQGRNYWVVTKGLVPNDQIVVSGHARIFVPMTPIQAAGPLQVQGKDGEALSEKSI